MYQIPTRRKWTICPHPQCGSIARYTVLHENRAAGTASTIAVSCFDHLHWAIDQHRSGNPSPSPANLFGEDEHAAINTSDV